MLEMRKKSQRSRVAKRIVISQERKEERKVWSVVTDTH